jgi:intraflagellar transport protein 80
MKFKTYVVSEPTLEGLTSSVSWSGVDEVYTCSNDHQILKWNSMHREMYQAAKLPEDFGPTSMDWLIGSSGGKGNDLLLITSLDGRFVILNKGARVEKNISAHQGSTIGKWSPDCSGLLTAGEDGLVKIWSRSGMLRSTVIQNETPIRCACWSPTSSAILFSQGSYLAIKPLLANSKTTKWRAHDHDHQILCVAWSVHGLIASGAEDCRYKIWDGQSGANVYTSSSDEYPITAIGFNSDGQLLAVGGFNMVRLCNKLGVSAKNCQPPS